MSIGANNLSEMKQKSSITAFRKGMLLVALILTNLSAASQNRDELQELIDRAAASPITRSGGEPTEIDLSAYSAPRTATLYIRNGANVRFVNGTLTRAESLKAPLIIINGNSYLELAETKPVRGHIYVRGNKKFKVR